MPSTSTQRADRTLLLEAVQELARRTGSVALRHFRSALTIESKTDGSPVTIADRSAEQAAREWIAQRFPDDGVVGEEFGTHLPAAKRRWLIDPIDGTKTFVRGVPLWGSLIAVCEDDAVLAGAAFFPALDEMLVAATGLGCWWNGTRAHVSATSSISAATVLTTDERFSRTLDLRDGWRRLADSAAISRSWGDCYGYLLVATGRAEVMVDGIVGPWDSAPLYPAITEAGGVFSDWQGKDTAFGGSIIATNAAIAAPARELLGGGGRSVG
ncbi:MAG TPA: inositol monophosphatase family protein [Gemmatimonadaceae bacterium]|jgi:histidinol phosphatase-like enzyme (inositol monophosphatase family)